MVGEIISEWVGDIKSEWWARSFRNGGRDRAESADAAKIAEMKLLSKQQDTAKVPMSEDARRLFDELRVRVLQIDTNIIEIAEQKSISYHGPAFFLEILPRKNRITLLLDLDFNEVDDPLDIARDASEYKFLVNAVYEGGVLLSILDPEDIENSLPLIRQAWERG